MKESWIPLPVSLAIRAKQSFCGAVLHTVMSLEVLDMILLVIEGFAQPDPGRVINSCCCC